MNGLTWKLFLLVLLLFIITDMFWLGFVARNWYFHYYKPWLRLVDGELKLIWWATFLVYLLLSISVIIFVIPLADYSPSWAAYYGAIMGAILYGVYNFTCIAIFKDFPVVMGLVDWLWGTLLCSWTSFMTVYLSIFLK